MNSREKIISHVTIVGSVVNLLLTGFKFFAGIIGHSSALVADAVHSLSDLISDVIILIFVRLSGRPEDNDHAYGHGKYETLASVIVGLILFIVGVGLLWDGVEKSVAFFNGHKIESPNVWALTAVILSLVAKEWLYRYTVKKGREIDSQVLIANAWHHRSDAITSVAALIGIVGAMLLGENWRVLDPLAAALVSVYIIIASWKLIKPGIDELLEKSLAPESLMEIENVIMSVPGVQSFHRLRTRRIGSRVVISCHLKLDGGITLREAHDIATRVEKKLKEKFGAQSIVTIHMEPASEIHNTNNQNKKRKET